MNRLQEFELLFLIAAYCFGDKTTLAAAAITFIVLGLACDIVQLI